MIPMMSKFFLPFLLTTLLLVMPSVGVAQRSVDEVFLSMPQDFVPFLSKEARMDMVDLFRSGLEAKVSNDFDGTSVLNGMTERGFDMMPTQNSMLSVRLLQTTKKDTLFAVVRTLRVPVADSRLTVFDSEWKPVKVGVKMVLSDFLNLSDEETVAQWRARLSPLHYEMKWLEGTSDLSVSPSIDALDIDSKKELRPLLRCRTWHWNGTDFELMP